MDNARAKEVLEGMGLDCFKTDLLYLEYRKLIKLAVEPGDEPDAAVLNGNFSADQLQAIALWMQDPEGVTNA